MNVDIYLIMHDLHLKLKDRQQSSGEIWQWACIPSFHSLILGGIFNDYTFIESKLIKEYNDGNEIQIIGVL